MSDCVNWEFMLRRSGKDLPNDEILLQVPVKATKPEIKQYLEKVYTLDVRKVNTLNTMGKIKRDKKRSSPCLEQIATDSKTPSVPTCRSPKTCRTTCGS